MEITIINKTKIKIKKEDIIRLIEKLSKELRFKGDITVLFCGDFLCRRINKKFLKRNRSTDVISFALKEDNYLGDILINLRQVERQARLLRIPFKKELKRIIIHGVLHLLDYDHEKDRGEMFELQEKLYKKIV